MLENPLSRLFLVPSGILNLSDADAGSSADNGTSENAARRIVGLNCSGRIERPVSDIPIADVSRRGVGGRIY